MHKCKAKRKGSNVRRDSQAWWERKLSKLGLGMEAGRKIGRTTITYGHMADLDYDGRVAVHLPITGESSEREECTSPC